jgi:hypothetical protein
VILGCGCGGHKPGGGQTAGDIYASNPQLAFIPADTAYAIVSFKPMPLALARRWATAADSMRLDDRSKLDPTSPLGGPMRVWDDALGRDHSPEHQAEVGVLENPRTSIYAIDGYPVMRIEIANGARLLPALQASAGRAGVDLPAPTRAGEWSIIVHSFGRFQVMAAIGDHELVAALAPADVIQRRRDLILGLERPAAVIEPSVFRQIAEREGLSGMVVGFVDVRRVIHAFANPAMLGGPCGTQIDAVAAQVPRVVLGYNVDDSGFDFRTVFELAPGVLAAIAGLASEIPRVERTGNLSIMSLAAAIDVDRAVALVRPVTTTLGNLAAACGVPDPGLAKVATQAEQLPPYLRGITGITGVMTAFDFTTEAMEGSVAIHSADATVLLDGFRAQAGGINVGLAPDRRAIQLFPQLIKPPVYAAMSAHSIAFARGDGAAEEAEAALGGDPQPAPLLQLSMDFGQFLRIVPGSAAVQLSRMFSVMTFTVDAGTSGLVVAGHMETPLTANVRAR